MTQRLIGAVSNKRMECPVFRISGKFCRKRWLYRRCVFLSRAWRTKSALTMRENLPFSVKSVLRSKKLYRADCCVKRKNRVVQDGKKRICSQAYQNMRNKSGARRAVFYCQYAEYRALFRCRKMLLPSCAYWWQGLCICTFGLGGEGRGAFFEKPIRLTGEVPFSLYAAYSPICICSTAFTFPSRKKKARFSFWGAFRKHFLCCRRAKSKYAVYLSRGAKTKKLRGN